MSAVSDPDRLERLAIYVCDYPPNATQEELSEALNDAAKRIRSLQDRLAAATEDIVQERHLGQLMFFAQQRWQSMAEDLWEELQEWHDEIDCPTFNGDGACTCHRILAEHWAQLTNAADYADDGVET